MKPREVLAMCREREVKAVDLLAPVHSRQLLTYLKVFGSPVGLILNFGAKTMREGIRRVVNRFPDGTSAAGAEGAQTSQTQETLEAETTETT